MDMLKDMFEKFPLERLGFLFEDLSMLNRKMSQLWREVNTIQHKISSIPKPEDMVLWTNLHEAMFPPVSEGGPRGAVGGGGKASPAPQPLSCRELPHSTWSCPTRGRSRSSSCLAALSSPSTSKLLVTLASHSPAEPPGSYRVPGSMRPRSSYQSTSLATKFHSAATRGQASLRRPGLSLGLDLPQALGPHQPENGLCHPEVGPKLWWTRAFSILAQACQASYSNLHSRFPGLHPQPQSWGLHGPVQCSPTTLASRRPTSSPLSKKRETNIMPTMRQPLRGGLPGMGPPRKYTLSSPHLPLIP